MMMWNKVFFLQGQFFEVPTFEVVTSVILDFGGHRYEEIKKFVITNELSTPGLQW